MKLDFDRKKLIRYYYELLVAKQEMDRWERYKESEDFATFYEHLGEQLAWVSEEIKKNPITIQEFAELGSDLVMELLKGD